VSEYYEETCGEEIRLGGWSEEIIENKKCKCFKLVNFFYCRDTGMKIAFFVRRRN